VGCIDEFPSREGLGWVALMLLLKPIPWRRIHDLKKILPPIPRLAQFDSVDQATADELWRKLLANQKNRTSFRVRDIQFADNAQR